MKKKIDFNSTYESTTVFEETLEEGQYEILVKDKIFQKLNIKFDRAPQIKFRELPTIKNDTFLKLSINVKDENNKYTFLTIREDLKFENARSKNEKISGKFGRISKINGHQSLLKPQKEENGELSFDFSRNLDFLPFEEKLNLTVNSIDKNNNFSSSSIHSLKFGSRIFYDPLANKIIPIRKKLYNDENLDKFVSSVSNLRKNLDEKYTFIDERLTNLMLYMKKTSVQKDEKIQKALVESWNIAITLEKINIEFILKEILDARVKLDELIKQDADDKQIEELLNKLEKLIESFEKFSENDIETQTSDVTKKPNDESTSLKNRTQEILDRIDQLIGDRKKNNLEIKEILNKLELISKEQKKLIEETFIFINKKLQGDIGSNKQSRISQLFNEVRPKLEDYFPEYKKIYKEIEKNFKESKTNLVQLEAEESIANQRNILGDIEKVIKNLINNSKETKKKGKPDTQNKDSRKKFDIPIIFENNSFDSIINEIKRLANEKNNDDREKEYLKKLLPKF